MIFGMMLSYLLGIGAFLMTLGLSVNAIWRAVMPPVGLPREAGCGSCGYELTTLGEGRCSECGADLLKSGVTTRRNVVRTAGSLPAALMGWTILVISVGSIGSMMLFIALAFNSGFGGGVNQAIVNSRIFEPEPLDAFGTGDLEQSAGYEVFFEFDGDYTFQGAMSGTVTIKVEGNDVTTPLTVEYDVETQDYTISEIDGPELSSGTGFDSESASQLLMAAGLDEQHPGIEAEALQVGEIFDAVIDDPMNFESGFYSIMDADALGGLVHSGGDMSFAPDFGFGSSGSELVITAVVLGVSGLIYVLGVVLIVRRRSKMIAQPRA